jgi:SAM-dependent methyltransferase
MTAAEKWLKMVEAEHAQSDKMRGGVPPPQDYWRGRASAFRADPHRMGDQLLDRLLAFIGPSDTVIDVGAGGGRLALPLALHCEQVVAVEPSESMISVLQEQSGESGIGNVSVVHSAWEDADVDPGDLVICAHVVYTVRDIGRFLEKLTSHARSRVAVVVYNAPPQSQIYPLWKQVHEEERLPLPSFPELLEVLEELGRSPTVDHLEARESQGFESMEQALEQLSGRLYVAQESPAAERLQRILPEMLVEDQGRLNILGSESLHQVVVSWTPD